MDRREADETRRLILRTARRLFLTQGYRAVTTRAIAEACGLTHPALYHYFARKEDVYAATILDEIARIHLALAAIQRRSDSVVERLRRATVVLLVTIDYDFGLMQHDIQNEVSPELSERLGIAFFGDIVAPLAALCAEGQTTGDLRDLSHHGLDTAGMATTLLALVAHFASMPPPVYHPGPRWQTKTLHAMALMIIDVLLHGIGRP